jgi:hypothetical protein
VLERAQDPVNGALRQSELVRQVDDANHT